MNDIPAFPRPHSGTTQYAQAGMTLRDYFAANAMQAMLNDTTIYENVAKYAYKMADEMMKARDNNG
jgi:hypothetical protein